ncbi:MAG: HEPN domain-containing protein [Tepidisphaeraceae bacterium]|jgi:HEPN domain-containing protein
MTEVVREWLAKASQDLQSALSEIDRGDAPNWDLICFLSQQCVEKLIKAALIARRVVPPKTHDLVQLHRLLQEVESSWKWDERELQFLSMSAVIYRYPGQWADRDVATRAAEAARRLHDALQPLLATPS